MGLLDKFKDQALNSISELANNIQEKVGEIQKMKGIQSDYSEVQNERIPPQPSQTIQSQRGPAIYGDYMENLIDMALVDGELTEKEKQVLFKKAEANGIDLDEFEMVLDAKLYERKKATLVVQPATQGAAPKSEKYGDVRKCPGCGAIVESFSTRCPDCGHEFINIRSVSSFNLLSSKLEALENQKKGTLWGAIKDQSIDKQKASLINGFPVPITKEDILEFVSMATPLAKPANKLMIFSDLDSGEYSVAKAWKSKCEQVIMKARFSMKDDKSLLGEIEQYAKQLKI